MKLNPSLEIAAAATIWGSAGVFVKILDLPPTTLSFFRFVVPTLVLALLVKKRLVRKKGRNTKVMLGASFLFAIRLPFYYLAFLLTSIGNAIIIFYTWPIFAAIFSSFYLKEKVTKAKTVLFVLSFLGIILMFSNKEFTFGGNDFIGMTAMLASSVMIAISTPLFKKELVKYSRTETIFFQNVVGAFLFLPFMIVNRPFPSFSQVAVASVYALLIGLVGHYFFFSGLKRLKMSTASLLSYFEVVSAIVLGVIIFKEVVTPLMLFGGGMIVISSILVTRLD